MGQVKATNIKIVYTGSSKSKPSTSSTKIKVHNNVFKQIVDTQKKQNSFTRSSTQATEEKDLQQHPHYNSRQRVMQRNLLESLQQLSDQPQLITRALPNQIKISSIKKKKIKISI